MQDDPHRNILVGQWFGDGIGGEGGIRTPDTVARMPHFECGAFNHSATSPSGAEGGVGPAKRAKSYRRGPRETSVSRRLAVRTENERQNLSPCRRSGPFPSPSPYR